MAKVVEEKKEERGKLPPGFPTPLREIVSITPKKILENMRTFRVGEKVQRYFSSGKGFRYSLDTNDKRVIEWMGPVKQMEQKKGMLGYLD
ncbi:hypothetical protein ACFLQ2_03335 [archaeon]